MSGCCPHSRDAGRIFSRFARRYRKRFEKRGFEASQRQLVAGLTQAGFRGATLLEIGSGTGYLHQTLLERGAASAVGVDLSAAMTAEACSRAAGHGLSERTRYITGDFMDLAADIEPADITLLDKVVCCYPDAHGLVHASLHKTRRVYALTYPRDRWFVRLGVKFLGVAMAMIRCEFRNYVHDPRQVEAWVEARGYGKIFEKTTLIWLTQVYVARTPDASV